MTYASVILGVWEGMSRAEVLERSPEDSQRYHEWEHNTSIAPPGGESFDDITAAGSDCR